DRVLAVLLHALPERPDDGRIVERRDVGGRRWRRRAQQVLEDPLAAHDWRRAIRLRRCCQDAALPEQTPALAVSKRHAPELAAVDLWNAVVACEPLVHERVVG